MTTKNSLLNKKWFLPALLMAILAIGLGIFKISSQPEAIMDADKIPVVLGHREGCLVCHEKNSGFTPSHDIQIVGCSGCHLGNPLTPDKENAHEGMERIPGNLETAMKTCGRESCHPSQVSNVAGSLMATAKGMVSVNRFVFGEAETPDGPGHLSRLSDSAADTHLRQLCVTCHLGFPKTNSRPIDEKSRGGGCVACHLAYSKTASREMLAYRKTGDLPEIHPSLDIKVNDDRCFGCHSRSARISLNFKGYMETEFTAEEVKKKTGFHILQDGRVVDQKGADAHAEKGMVCIDCHTVRETMGDGTEYDHQGEQIEISCDDCHTNDPGSSVAFEQLDSDSQKISRLRGFDAANLRFRQTLKTNKPILNLLVDRNGETRFQGKLDNEIRELKPPASACSEIGGHERLTCQACHTKWTPVCVNCHTQFEPKRKRADHYTKELVTGTWQEYKSEQLALPPTLGIRRDKRSGRDVVDTFIPGMIMTIDGIADHKPDYQAKTVNPGKRFQIFRRLFSPTSSHTIQKGGRSCEECHLDPWTMGYGQGQIVVDLENNSSDLPLRFIPSRTTHPADGLPRDAWTGFLTERDGMVSTRTGARPFNVKEQKRILSVGVCLECHESTDSEIDRIYNRFDWALANRTKSCYQVGSNRGEE